MSKVIEYLLIIGFTFNFVYLFSFVTGVRAKSVDGKLISAFLLISLLEIANAFLLHSQWIKTFPHLLRINTPFVFLLGPIVWLLIKNQFTLYQVGRKDYIHFIPFFACIVYLVPVFFASANAKIEYVEQLYSGLSTDSYIIGVSRRIQQAFYLGLIARIIVQNRIPSGARTSKDMKLSVGLFVIFGFLWFISLIRILFWFNLNGGFIEVILLCLLATGLVYAQLGTRETRALTAKYKTSGLSKEIIDKYISKIQVQLMDERIFLNPDLSLPVFAQQIAIPAHHLSQVFNQEMKVSFTELVNQHRITEAKRLLLTDKAKHLKIETIAQQAGFKSTSVFNTTFKRLTGLSPKKFRFSRELEILKKFD